MNLRRPATLIRTVPPLRWGARLLMRVVAPRQWVGAVGAVFNARGEVLLLEHAFRTDYPWGLPGGWVERNESPADAVRREIGEEVHLEVDVRCLLHCAPVAAITTSVAPSHLGLGYLCRLTGGTLAISSEILTAEWVDPRDIKRDLAPFQRRVIEMGWEQLKREEQLS